MIKTDSVYLIGSSHQICQDYAMSGTYIDDTPYAIVSDGCSSSENSDIGSRILSLTARSTVSELLSDDTMDEWFARQTIRDAGQTVNFLTGLNSNCLDATLLAVSVGKDDCINSIAFGDGYIAYGTFDNFSILEISYTANYPMYLNYRRDPSRLESLKGISNNLLVKRIRFKDGIYTGEHSWEEEPSKPIKVFMPNTIGNFVAVISDGLGSFSKKERNLISSVSAIDIIPRLFSFKTTTGEFVKRRVLRVMKELRDEEITHYDDFSMAMIYSGED